MHVRQTSFLSIQVFLMFVFGFPGAKALASRGGPFLCKQPRLDRTRLRMRSFGVQVAARVGGGVSRELASVNGGSFASSRVGNGALHSGMKGR